LPRVVVRSRIVLKLFLVRHGHAGDPEAWKRPDDSRPLTAKGRSDFRRTAQAFARREKIDVLCTSPLVRAVQTAEILAAALELDDVPVWEELRPDVPVQALLERASGEDVKRLALVGHDPQITGILAALTKLAPESLEFPKGAIVRLDVRDLRAREAEARWWLPPREKEPREGVPLRSDDEG
jgi:phosphohistidine phosphatase